MRYHPYRLQVMVHRHLVRNDIDAISKTTLQSDKGAKSLSISGKLCAVRCDLRVPTILIILLFFKLICPEVNNKRPSIQCFNRSGNFALKMRTLISFVLINASSALVLSK
jgi:hypothetical protein